MTFKKWLTISVLIWMLVVLAVSLGIATCEAQSVVFAPALSIRDAKLPDVPMDFTGEMQLRVRRIIVNELQIAMSYEREAGEYYWSNDYRLAVFGAYCRDFRSDLRDLHNIEAGYLTRRLPFIAVGSAVTVDKLSRWYVTAVTEFDVGWIRARYQRGKVKQIIDCEVMLSRPLKRVWIFESAGELRIRYYDDSAYQPVRSLVAGMSMGVR